ncbi:DUF2325 domain-containing protein [Robbsia betulipollinis]|nr:DUF2325 domain-containing protein [Robbsia betulipollinis]
MKPCCIPGETAARRTVVRTRLSDLDSHLQCSVIGTCLSTADLRRLVPKFTVLERGSATDLELHHAAVELAVAGGPGAKALQKTLDERHAGAIRLLKSCDDEDALVQAWKGFVKAGDVASGYWALMCHPLATLAVQQVAFGDIHMLSHLVGASNRADIRRLVALEEENVALHEKIARQQQRLQQVSVARDALVRELRAQIVEQAAQLARQRDLSGGAEAADLRDALAQAEQRLALQAGLRETAERRSEHERQQAKALRDKLAEAFETLRVVQAEAEALECAMPGALAGGGGGDAGLRPNGAPAAPHDAAGAACAAATGETGETDAADATARAFAGKRIVYVGGRPASHAPLKALVASYGGRLLVHDGGIEDRKGLLAAMLPGADSVVFPVDCIDHGSMQLLKRVCDQHRIAYHPLRTASVASFLRHMRQVHGETANPIPVARCLRNA